MRSIRSTASEPIRKERSKARLPQARVPSTPRRSQAGFSLVELMIVVVIIGILAAIAVPNFLAMQKRASEGNVKANMHTVQITLEDFGLLNDGQYPVAASTQLSDGRNLAQVCPTGSFPKNPYTRIPSVVQFNSDPSAGAKGELAINPALTTSYIVKANGWDGATLPLTLSSGQ